MSSQYRLSADSLGDTDFLSEKGTILFLRVVAKFSTRRNKNSYVKQLAFNDKFVVQVRSNIPNLNKDSHDVKYSGKREQYLRIYSYLREIKQI